MIWNEYIEWIETTQHQHLQTHYGNIPNDSITKRFKEVLNDYENLPANFYYYNNIPESYGLPLLELKSEYMKPIRNIPLLSRLTNGDYQTENSKTDYKIVKDIKFFTNNLPSFKKYKNADDLSYIITNHRSLMLEMFEYYKIKNPSLKTLEWRITAILRIFYISYDDKKYDLYQKYSIMMLDLLFSFKQDEDNQVLNKNEDEWFIPFEIVIEFQSLLKQYILNPTYKNNQDLSSISLYRYLPERDELKTLTFNTIYKTDNNYIYIDNDIIYLLLNNEKKRHGKLHINLTKDFKDLAGIIMDSYFKFKRTYVFTDYNNKNKQISIHGLYKRIINLYSFTGKRVGVNILRSSYLTYQSQLRQAQGKILTVAD